MLIRRLRLERAWTQEQLAIVLGVNVRTVQRLERGAVPSLETAQALAGAFGQEARLFLGGAPPPVLRPGSEATARPREAGPSSPMPERAGGFGARLATAYLLIGGVAAAIVILGLLVGGASAAAAVAVAVGLAAGLGSMLGLGLDGLGRRSPAPSADAMGAEGRAAGAAGAGR